VSILVVVNFSQRFLLRLTKDISTFVIILGKRVAVRWTCCLVFLMCCVMFHPEFIFAQNADTSRTQQNVDTIPFWRSHSLRLTADGTFQSGNVERILLRSGASTVLTSNIFEIEASALYAYGEQNKQSAENDVLANGSVSVPVHNALSALFFGTSEISRLRRIDFRYQAGIGGKYVFFHSAKNSLKSSVVALFDETDFANSTPIASTRISLRIKGRHQLIESYLFFSHETFYQPSINFPQRDFRWRTSATIEVPISKTFSLTSTFVNSYESIVSPGRLNNDATLTVGISSTPW
jgi:ABC-type maltose transport system permease subunit